MSLLYMKRNIRSVTTQLKSQPQGLFYIHLPYFNTRLNTSLDRIGLHWACLSFQPRGGADQLRSIMRPWLNHARKVDWLTIDDMSKSWKKKTRRTRNGTYRTPAALYSFLGSISWPFSSTLFSKSKVDRTDAAASMRVEWAMCFPAQILVNRMDDGDRYWDNDKLVERNKRCPYLLPNPNTISIGSLTELSSCPFFKKRLGLNSCGSG